MAIPGYTIFRSDRKSPRKRFGRDSGGAAIYVRNDIANTFEPTTIFSNGAVEIISIYSKVEQLHIASVYRQPDNKINRSIAKHLKQGLNKLNSALAAIPQQNIIITGDFNLPHANWMQGGSKYLPGATSEEKEMIQLVMNLSEEYFLTQHIHKPTHKDGNILDLILTNNEDIIHSYECHIPLRSQTHHNIIEVNSTLNSSTNNIKNPIDPATIPPLRTLNFHSDKSDWTSLRQDLSQIDWTKELTGLSPNDMVNKITTISFNISTKHVPKSTTRGEIKHSKVPIDRRKLMRRRNRINKRIINTKSATTKEKLHKELIQIEKQLHKSRLASKYYEEQKAIKSIKKNSKYFFTYAKKFSKTRASIGPLKDDNIYIYDNKEMADILARQYKSVFSSPTSTCPSKEELFPNNSDVLNNLEFEAKDFITAINELSETAGSGPDGFPAILLKQCKEQYATALHILWNSCFEAETTPTVLNQPTIIPKYKGDSKSDPANFRPIALTSHLIKIFEKVIRTKLVSYLEDTNQFNPNQHGFRKGRSCLSQLLAHHDMVTSLLEQGIGVDTVYLDFSKAFDKVDFETLLKKLRKVGIGGKIGRWIHSFLTDRTQTVIVNNETSSPTNVISGVPQGSVLGPLLFIIMISDIDEDTQYSILRCFADDTRVTKGISNTHDATQLQTDLNTIYDWACKNKMEFNNKKFEVLRYRAKDPIQDLTSYTTSTGHIINEKTDVKDLGIIMSNDCSFSAHIKKTTSSLRNMSAWILRTFSTRDSNALLTAWKALALPIHDYCSQLWSPYKQAEIIELENIQWSFIRKFRDYTFTDYWDALTQLKMYSLQ